MVKQTNPDVFKMHKLAHFQRDAHPRRTNVTCGIPSKAKKKKKKNRDAHNKDHRGYRSADVPNTRRQTRRPGGDGGERREGASVSFAPIQSEGGRG